jgi:hypothetical protein
VEAIAGSKEERSSGEERNEKGNDRYLVWRRNAGQGNAWSAISAENRGRKTMQIYTGM